MTPAGTRGRSLAVAVLVLVAAGIAVGVAPRLPGWYWNARASNPVRRGAQLAASQGCLACHVPAAGKEHANPGSRWGSVPSFFGGNAMMYIRSPEEVEHWIAEGLPRPGAARHVEAGSPPPPFYMQAFKNRLSTAEIRDLADFVLAADGYHLPHDGLVARGAELSRTYGCESCHGVAGSGGVRNPGAFIGSVASWVGPDFPHLVADRAEFGEWVLDGRSRRFKSSRPASFFLDRANLFMPAFRGHLGEAEVDALWAYVQWLRGRWERGGAVGAAGGP